MYLRKTDLEKAEMNVAGGVYSAPASSMGFKISKSAIMLAMASHILASARAFPGHTLVHTMSMGEDNMSEHRVEHTVQGRERMELSGTAHLRPNPNTKLLGRM